MIDVKQQISAVRRTVGSRRLEAGEARVSTLSQVLDTGIDDLWDVVTNAERIPRWFLPISGDLREGGRYQLKDHAGGTISRCDKPRGFAATWEYGGDVSWIEVRLTAEGPDRTRLELEHVAHVADEFWDQFGPGATGLGWDSMLYGMAGHLSDPEAALDPADAVAWMASDEGHEFLRLAADAWAEADIAAGTDTAEAQAKGDRSYGAYTAG
jgi:uncharacterized protein YndB with AHSA1/START domain